MSELATNVIIKSRRSVNRLLVLCASINDVTAWPFWKFLQMKKIKGVTDMAFLAFNSNGGSFEASITGEKYTLKNYERVKGYKQDMLENFLHRWYAPGRSYFVYGGHGMGDYLELESDKVSLQMHELAAIMGNRRFEAVLFDACFMSNLDCAYYLRHNTRYIGACEGYMWEPDTELDHHVFNTHNASVMSRYKDPLRILQAIQQDYCNRNPRADFAILDTTHAAALREFVQNYVIQRVYNRTTFYNSLQRQLLRQYAAAASARVNASYTLAGAASMELAPVRAPGVVEHKNKNNNDNNNNIVLPHHHHHHHYTSSSSLPLILQDGLHHNIITIGKHRTAPLRYEAYNANNNTAMDQCYSSTSITTTTTNNNNNTNTNTCNASERVVPVPFATNGNKHACLPLSPLSSSELLLLSSSTTSPAQEDMDDDEQIKLAFDSQHKRLSKRQLLENAIQFEHSLYPSEVKDKHLLDLYAILVDMAIEEEMQKKWNSASKYNEECHRSETLYHKHYNRNNNNNNNNNKTEFHKYHNVLGRKSNLESKAVAILPSRVRCVETHGQFAPLPRIPLSPELPLEHNTLSSSESTDNNDIFPACSAHAGLELFHKVVISHRAPLAAELYASPLHGLSIPIYEFSSMSRPVERWVVQKRELNKKARDFLRRGTLAEVRIHALAYHYQHYNQQHHHKQQEQEPSSMSSSKTLSKAKPTRLQRLHDMSSLISAGGTESNKCNNFTSMYKPNITNKRNSKSEVVINKNNNINNNNNNNKNVKEVEEEEQHNKETKWQVDRHNSKSTQYVPSSINSTKATPTETKAEPRADCNKCAKHKSNIAANDNLASYEVHHVIKPIVPLQTLQPYDTSNVIKVVMLEKKGRFAKGKSTHAIIKH